MKWFILIFIAASASFRDAVALDFGRFSMFPGGDKKLYLIDSHAPIDVEFVLSQVRDGSVNEYWLYTRKHPTEGQHLQILDEDSVNNSDFNAKKETVILGHGWKSDLRSNFNLQLTEAFLEKGDVNVIVLDWSQLAMDENYFRAMNGVAEVGRNLGKFIHWLSQKFGLSLDNVHLIGHSLGGHLVGNAGRQLEGQVKRITALDPAGPNWKDNEGRLVSTDGRYVEVIHTTINVFIGYDEPCGHSDHYPNGGTHPMPGCFILDPVCSHSKAWEYMVATVKEDHLLANRCKSVNYAIQNNCEGVLKPMGNGDIHKQQNGIFRVNTGAEYPFARVEKLMYHLLLNRG